MQLPTKFPAINFFFLLLFASAWFWSEVMEYRDRAEHRHEVDRFMEKGGRFTHEDGDKLRARIERLEVYHE